MLFYRGDGGSSSLQNVSNDLSKDMSLHPTTESPPWKPQIQINLNTQAHNLIRSRSEVLMAVTMQSGVFWVVRVLPRSSVTARIFGDIYSLHFQATRETKQEKSETNHKLVSYLIYFSTLKIEYLCSFETSGCLRTRRRYNSEERTVKMIFIFFNCGLYDDAVGS
jgi:hypothetical protein